MQWYSKKPYEIFKELQAGEHGLSAKEAVLRLKNQGLNALPEAKRESLFFIFFRQFRSPLIYVLIGAGGIVFYLQELIDALIILFVLLFNAIIGTLQEGRAQDTLAALKQFTQTLATVVRDGKERVIPDTELVVGDIVILREGEKIPADARVIAEQNLKVDEAALTGESEAVHKTTTFFKRKDLATAEQRNMVFKGTHVVAGSGRAVVVATGIRTVIGKISKKISGIDSEIPLKADIRSLTNIIVIGVIVIVGIVFMVGVSNGQPLLEMFITVVSLAVSLIPEGLPIVLTLVLAMGVWRMGKRHALVKHLQAVEALGQARVIAIDKTGTITKNEMVVQKVYADGKYFEIGGVGYSPKGDVLINKKNGKKQTIVPLDFPELVMAARVASLCSNAHVSFLEEDKMWQVSGDPTEAALLVFGQKVGFQKDDVEQHSPLVQDIPFDYRTKYHMTVHKTKGGKFLTVVGAPEKILDLSKRIWDKEGSKKMTKKDREKLEEVFYQLSSEGLRILAFATRNRVSTIDIKDMPPLIFGGFYAMRDAIRPEVQESIAQAVEAGIHMVMITGDHKVTGQAVAKEVGIFHEGDDVLTGKDVEDLSDTELSRRLASTSVFARVTPEHKLRIIQSYKQRGEIVAMTGDGVNDAPSLVAADLGVAMGKIGTEVAKEAADIVLLDDNLSSIIAAIEEGRGIYKSIRKVVLYLLSTSLGEAITIVAALLLGFPLPVIAAQILWLNLVTDGFLDVALAMDPKEKELLKGSFKRSGKYFVDGLMLQRMITMSIPMAFGTLFLFKDYIDGDMTKAWTIALTTLAVFQWFNVWNARSETKSIFQMNPFSNLYLIAATLVIIGLHFVAIYTPFMQQILRTTALSFEEWLLIIPVAFSIIIAEELRKFVYRIFHGRENRESRIANHA